MPSRKLDLRRVPRAARSAFGWILAPLKVAHAKPLSFATRPVAAFARVEKAVASNLERALADGGPEALIRRMFEPVAAITPRQWGALPARLAKDLEKRRAAVMRLHAGQPLLALMDAVHVRVRNGPLVAMIDPGNHAKLALRAYSRILRVRSTRGEAKTDATLDAILFLWENVYQPYLQSVWKLLQVLDLCSPLNPPSGGSLMRNLERRLGGAFPKLVEPLALRIRNAVAHGHFEPRVANTIALSNKDDWHANLHQDELEAIMCNMFAVSTVTFVDAMNTFSLRAMMEPLLPVFPEFARGGRRQRD